jgi:hypothetical protein
MPQLQSTAKLRQVVVVAARYGDRSVSVEPSCGTSQVIVDCLCVCYSACDDAVRLVKDELSCSSP